MSQQKRAVVIHSPYAGNSNRLERALIELQQAEIEIIDMLSIASLDGLAMQGAQWIQRGAEVAIAAGGDGLVGGVITHIAECGLPLGILPLGTSNDIARSLGIPQDTKAAVEVLKQGKRSLIDIGVAQPAEQAPHGGSDKNERHAQARISAHMHGYFAHALTLGVNVEFARQATNIVTRQRFGRLTYPLTALNILREHHALHVTLQLEGVSPSSKATEWEPSTASEHDSITYSGDVLQISVINAPIFGGMWQLAIPGASLYDRLLDIIIIEDVDLARLSVEIAHRFQRPVEQPSQALANLSRLQRAELTGIPGIHHVRACAISISTEHEPQDITLDGEVRSQSPANVRMADKQLAVFTG